MKTVIDFRAHDQRERSAPADTLDFRPDPELSEFIREGIRAMREQTAFSEAERRMRVFRTEAAHG